MKFQIITPERIVFSEEVDQASFMTTTGEITVLPNHIPLVTVLAGGELRYKKNGEEHVLAVSGGFAEVRPGSELVILADTAERADEIDLARVADAKQRAIKAMADAQHREDVDYSTLQGALERAILRETVGKKYRKLKKIPGQ